MATSVVNTVNAARLDIKAYAGAILGDQGFEITLTDQNGNPINPTPPIRMEVRLNAQSPALLVFTENDGLTLVGNVITLLKQVDLKGGVYLYDLVQVNADKSVTPYLYGEFIVYQNITYPRG